MARKSTLKAVGLFDKAPLQEAAAPSPAAKPKKQKRVAPTRDETLYSFTFRLRLDQRQALDHEAQERRRPTAPGKTDASEVLREILDEWMGKR